MKNILKKNQVIITALVIMIAVAGYLNFTQDKTKDLAGKDGDPAVASMEQDAIKEEGGMDISQLTLDAEGNEVVEADPADAEILDLSAEDIGADEEADAAQDASAESGKAAAEASADTSGVLADSGDPAGEAVLVSNMIGKDYFASAKLTREQTRAKNKEMLMTLVDNTNLTEQQKQDAVDQVVEMTAVAEKEGSAEILLGAKGFEDVVVNMMNDGVDVIVNADKLTEQQMAQIEDIVKRKTGIAVENIVITPVGVEE